MTAALSLGVLVIAASVSAAQTDSLRFAFDMDVPAGRYSFWRIESLGSATRLNADFQVVELRRHRDWGPGFSFSLKSGDSTLTVQLATTAGNAPLNATVQHYVANDVVDQAGLAGSFMLQDTIALGLDWSSAGRVLVTLGANSRSVKLPFRPQSLEVVTSTGEMFVHRMVLTKPRK